MSQNYPITLIESENDYQDHNQSNETCVGMSAKTYFSLQKSPMITKEVQQKKFNSLIAMNVQKNEKCALYLCLKAQIKQAVASYEN